MIAPAPTPAKTPGKLVHKLWQTHAPLTLSALLTLLATLLFIVGLFADPRTITGAPAWLKPVKFGVSITLYSLTLTWVLSLIRGRARLVAVLGWTRSNSRVGKRAKASRSSEPTRLAHPTAGRGCRSWAGARKGATCGFRTLSGCTRCRSFRF